MRAYYVQGLRHFGLDATRWGSGRLATIDALVGVVEAQAMAPGGGHCGLTAFGHMALEVERALGVAVAPGAGLELVEAGFTPPAGGAGERDPHADAEQWGGA